MSLPLAIYSLSFLIFAKTETSGLAPRIDKFQVWVFNKYIMTKTTLGEAVVLDAFVSYANAMSRVYKRAHRYNATVELIKPLISVDRYIKYEGRVFDKLNQWAQPTKDVFLTSEQRSKEVNGLSKLDYDLRYEKVESIEVKGKTAFLYSKRGRVQTQSPDFDDSISSIYRYIFKFENERWLLDRKQIWSSGRYTDTKAWRSCSVLH